MRAESAGYVAEIQRSLELLRARLDWDTVDERMARLDARAEDPELWSNPAAAQKMLRERRRLAKFIADYRELEQELEDLEALAGLGKEEGDPDTEMEAEQGLFALSEHAQKRELEALLSGETDGNDAYLEINAGAGGTESCDWAEMLDRMYRRWAQKRGFTVETVSETAGEEAGLRSVTMQVAGEDAYGWLKSESGIHRLVRISPFDSQGRRHTSFASVWVVPVLDETIEIDIQEKDLRVDTFRSSGAGGQHVNKTDSAVRITHIPTGTVAVSSEKSQHQNRAQAIKILRARLYDLECQKRDAEKQKLEASKTDIGWGHQIRSYVLQPHRFVKDLRTGETSTNTDSVLNGELDSFMAAELLRRMSAASHSERTGR